MPPEITTKTIVFENSNKALAVVPPGGTGAKEIAKALNITQPKAVLLIIGGADKLDEKVTSRLIQLFGRGIARAAVEVNALIIDGGTESGVMKMMGQGVADRGYQSTLIGVAPHGLVKYPGGEGGGDTPLDPNHSHFVLIEGNDWGDETGTIFKLVNWFKDDAPTVVLLAGGGNVTRHEALQAVRKNLPLIVVEGSGGVADEIASAWKARPGLPDDPLLAEIVADGRIQLHGVKNSVNGAKHLLIRELGGDNVLRQAWERFADYDLNAKVQQERFNQIQGWILGLGLAATALALSREVFGPEEVTGVSFWGFIKYVLIILPIILTVVITASNRFKQGNKWLLLRAGAESIKREIYRYRARAGVYEEVPAVPPAIVVPPAAPETPPPPPPPTPEQVLAERVEDITRRTMRTDVNLSALVRYPKAIPPPPEFAAAPGDDGFTVLTPDRYIQVRLTDQLNWYRKKAVQYERKLRHLQWTIFILGGLGTLLAAIDQQVWIALTTAVAAAVATYLSYKQTENTLLKYNQAATDLDSVRSWWTALPADEQAKQKNLSTLVDHTEMVLQTEHDGWVQQMQNALAELRKDQERAPAQGPLSGGTGAPPTEGAKTGAATTTAGVTATTIAAKPAEANTETPAPTIESTLASGAAEEESAESEAEPDETGQEGESQSTESESTEVVSEETVNEETTDDPKPPEK